MTAIDHHSHLLTALLPPERVRGALLPRERWHPFPTVGERAPWQALPEQARSEWRRAAEQRLGMAWPELPATLFLEFARNGNRSRFEAHHFDRRAALTALVLGECVEGEGRFLDDIVNGVWALCEESFWGVSAHSYSGRPPFDGRHGTPRAWRLGLPDTAYRVVDLFAAETGALLAWTWYLLREQLAVELPVVVDRIEREVQERILAPYRTIDDWRWLGLNRASRTNNWNPWIHSNILTMNLLLEPDPRVRADTVARVIDGLDAFLAWYHTDGGCDEGTSYWGRAGGSLYDCLELLRSASAGALDGFTLPLVAEIGKYLYRMHIGGRWYVNFADGAAKIVPEGGILFRYGQRIGDPLLSRQGAFVYRDAAAAGDRASGRTSIGRLLPDLFDRELPEADATPPLVRDAWLDGVQVLTARERAGSTDGLFLAAKGGHNGESHNHNDVGSFIVALDGEPVLIDVGVETYTRQTFGPERYSIWTMRSLYHNLPVVNGVEQAPGVEFAARAVEGETAADHAQLALDIAGAYPPEAGIVTWRRTLRLDRGPSAHITLRDAYELAAPPRSLALHLMARAAVDAGMPGVLRCTGTKRQLLVHYDAAQFEAAVERIAIADARLGPVWGEAVYRVILTARAPAPTGVWTLTMAAG